MNDKAVNTLKESLLEDIPMKNGKVQVNEHRIQQSRNLKSLILVTLGNRTEIKQQNKSIKNIQNTGFAISVVFAVAIVGIVAGWDWAVGASVLSGVGRVISIFIGKS